MYRRYKPRQRLVMRVVIYAGLAWMALSLAGGLLIHPVFFTFIGVGLVPFVLVVATLIADWADDG